MKTIHCEQKSSEWLQARCGIVTASEFDKIISPEWTPRKGLGVDSYLHKKAAERIMGYVAQSFSGGAMEQGNIMESRALPWYEFRYNTPIERVGLCLSDDGKVGCSPDGLIGSDAGIECKCPEAHTHVKYLLGGCVPKEYLAQIHGSMYVTGRKEWIFMSYSPFFPPLIIRVLRDEAIQKAIGDALTTFVAQLDAAEVRLRGIIEGAQKREKIA